MKIQKRIRKTFYDPKKFLRLHRGENAHSFNKKKEFSENKYYPDASKVIDRLSKIENTLKNQIVIGLGSESLIKDTLIMLKLLNKKKIMINDPTFYSYELFAKFLNFKIYKYFIDPNMNDLDKNQNLIKSIKKKKPDILILGNPFSPVEFSLNNFYQKKLINYCKKNKIILIVDEVYQWDKVKSFKKYLTKYNDLIIIKSFSKILGLCGIRFGYCITNLKYYKILNSLRLSSEIPSYTLRKVENYLDSYNENIFKIKKKTIEAKNELKKILANFNIKPLNQKIISSLIFFKSKIIKQRFGEYLIKNSIIVNYNFKNKILSNYVQITTTNKNNIIIFGKYFKKFMKDYDQ